MSFLARNWFWMFLALAGLVYFLARSRRQRPRGRDVAALGYQQAEPLGHRDGAVSAANAVHDPSAPHHTRAAIDPVSGAAVRTSDALTSVYKGTIYYFDSKASRERFESSPEEFASNAPTDGDGVNKNPRHRRHGC